MGKKSRRQREKKAEREKFNDTFQGRTLDELDLTNLGRDVDGCMHGDVLGSPAVVVGNIRKNVGTWNKPLQLPDLGNNTQPRRQ